MKRTLIIASFLATILFIATIIVPSVSAIESSISEGCSLCAEPQLQLNDEEMQMPPPGPNCETCGEAVSFAVDYMVTDMNGYLQELLEDGWYFLVAGDFAIEVTKSLITGFAFSGFNIEIDKEELKENVLYWTGLLVGQQQHLITLFLAALVAIAVGVTGYLLTLCGGVMESFPASEPLASEPLASEPLMSEPETMESQTMPMSI